MTKELTERVAFIQGLIEGMGSGTDEKEGRVVSEIARVLMDMARAVEDIKDRQVETEGRIDSIDEDLAFVEENLYDDEEYVDIECPHCKETICFDEELLDGDDEVCCPSCGGVIFSADDDGGDEAGEGGSEVE